MYELISDDIHLIQLRMDEIRYHLRRIWMVEEKSRERKERKKNNEIIKFSSFVLNKNK
jgi:hypothetical protein